MVDLGLGLMGCWVELICLEAVPCTWFTAALQQDQKYQYRHRPESWD
jgi:hypothetical protein